MRLSQALTNYEAHVRSMGLEPRTIKNRLQPVSRGLSLWGDVRVGDIEPSHIDSLFEGSGYAPRTRNLYLGHLRRFFDWARHVGIMKQTDPTYGWRSRKVESKDRIRVPVEQFGELLDCAEHPRDRAVLAIGLYTFMRGSEIQALKRSDLSLADSRVRIYRQKTKEQDNLPVCTELAIEMERWLEYYQSQVGIVHHDYYLVPSKGPYNWAQVDGVWTCLGESSLRPKKKMTHPYRVAQRALTELGVEDTKNEGIHTLRRSGARALLDTLRSEGVDSALLRVGAMLGHKDTKVTAHYVGLSQEREARDTMLAGRQMFPSPKPGLRMVQDG